MVCLIVICSNLFQNLKSDYSKLLETKIQCYEITIEHSSSVNRFDHPLVRGLKSYQNTFDKINVHEFELVDKNNKRRASIKVEKGGEVVFRLFDSKETIRVKLGAEDDGFELVLLNDKTDLACMYWRKIVVPA